MLEPRANNDRLQKYLESKNQYDTASFGETTSADELTIRGSSGAEDSSGSIDIFRESSLSRQYDLAQSKAAEIEQYEAKVVEKYT